MGSLFLQNRYIAAALIGLLTSMLIMAADAAGVFGFLDRKAYDALFCLRAVIGPVAPEVPVVMIDVDDVTFKAEKGENPFHRPKVLWHEYFAEVIKALADAEAAVIGLDYLLPSTLFDDLIQGYSEKWFDAFRYAIAEKNVPVVTGYAIGDGRHNVLHYTPHIYYQMIIEKKNLGFFNLYPDGDGIVRRQHIIYDDRKDDDPLYSFAYLLLKAVKPDSKPPSETVYVDFMPREDFFPRYSFSEVYYDAIGGKMITMKKRFKDKIVIIGDVHSLTMDRHLTPLHYMNQKRMAGSEIQASIVHTLYGDRYFRETGAGLRYALYLCAALLAAVAAILLPFRGAFWSLIALVLVFLLVTVAAFFNYTILPVVPEMAAVGLSLILSFSYRYGVVDKKRRRMQHLFQVLLTPEVADGVMNLTDEELLKGKEERLCILFSDIRGFTDYAKEKDATKVLEKLNEYYEAMSEAIFREKGVVSRFFGDGLLAFFKISENDDNPSLRGVNAALNMVGKLQELNFNWKRGGRRTFRIGIGLHTGKVVFGGMGSAKRLEFTLTGDTANLASRVEGKTKDLEETILITDAVYADVKDRLPAGGVEFVDKGKHEVKGRDPVHLYAIPVKYEG